MKKILLATLISLASCNVLANDEAPAPAPAGNGETPANVQKMLDEYFGIGIMANVDAGGTKTRRVKSARVEGGVVRIQEESKAQLGFLLEAHKFVTAPLDSAKRVVAGPYVGIVIGSGGQIDSGILGVMFGFRTPKAAQGERTLNVGLGLSITPNAQVLGDGITEGQALPPGETEVRYKNTTKYGVAITVSFGF